MHARRIALANFGGAPQSRQLVIWRKTNLTGRARCASAVRSRSEFADYRLSRASPFDQGTIVRLTGSFNGRHRSRGSPNKVKLIAEEQNGQTSDEAAIRSPQCSAIVDCFQVAVAQARQSSRVKSPKPGGPWGHAQLSISVILITYMINIYNQIYHIW